MPHWLLRNFDAMGLPVLEAYALTETCAAATINRLDDNRQGTVGKPLAGVEAALAGLPAAAPVRLSPLVPFDEWAGLADIRATSRARQAEGLMLKRRDAPYTGGRPMGPWPRATWAAARA